jgi:putative DNA methylase
MARMIERWFPCQEVSENSESGWGSGNSEASLFTWFAKRPLAQAKAAVLTSLLPWPDDPQEQNRLQNLVRSAFSDADAAHDELTKELARWYPGGASMLDPFSGRAMIPLEAARIGVRAWGIDYSFVATVGGQLLADFPLLDWSREPPVPFARDQPHDELAWSLVC